MFDAEITQNFWTPSFNLKNVVEKTCTFKMAVMASPAARRVYSPASSMAKSWMKKLTAWSSIWKWYFSDGTSVNPVWWMETLYWVSQKKLLHKIEGKTAPKKEDDLAESCKFGTWLTALWYLFLQKNIFLFLINIADMAI